MNNLILANIKAGQITTTKLSAEEIPDDMIRDGWVEVHREIPPKIHVVTEQGRAYRLYSDRPGLQIQHTDLDVAQDYEEEKQKLKASVTQMFHYPITD